MKIPERIWGVRSPVEFGKRRREMMWDFVNQDVILCEIGIIGCPMYIVWMYISEGPSGGHMEAHTDAGSPSESSGKEMIMVYAGF